MKQISPRVLYLERADWGANPRYPRLGGPEAGLALIPRERRVYNIVHHTVLVDSSDRSPNIWEDLEWAKLKMLRLQTIRPDLGDDVPYNFVGMFRPRGELLVCEGRGYDRSGAHTAGVDGQPSPWGYFNVSGIATSFQGNFEDFAFDLGPWLPSINDWFAHLGRELPNLGTRTVVAGKTTSGHKDHSRFSGLNATACPGQHLYRILPQITLKAPQEEDDLNADETLRLIIPEIDKRVAATNGLVAQIGTYARDTRTVLGLLGEKFATLNKVGGWVDLSGLEAEIAALKAKDAKLDAALKAAADALDG